MMLSSLSLKNFRAFRAQKFEFSRLNIFVGPNNSGKSSVISSLNLLAQTISSNDSGAPLLLRGKHDDLGTYIDVVHGNIPRTLITFEISFGEYRYVVEYKYRTQRREIEIVKYELFLNNYPLFQYKSRKDAYDLRYQGKKFEQIFGSSIKRRPIFDGLLVREPNLRRVRFSNVKTDQKELFLDAEETKNLFDIERQLFRANRELEITFQRYDFLSPFREPPRRTYLYSGEAPKEVGRSGEKAVDILVSDNFARGKAKRGLVDQVSSFFESTGMAKGVEVKPLTSRHFELCLVGNDGSSRNFSDVGFGCSQVLPVLVGGLNLIGGTGYGRSRPIFVVEEPEIHLHPDAQAELGSFFVTLAEMGTQLFIETHSDNLILRIQRHVASGELDSSLVRVFFLQDIAGEKQVTTLDLDNDGVFKKGWPGGFFPQRQKESLKLARAAANRDSDGK